MYKVKLRKNHETELIKSCHYQYKQFSKLFGVKKSHLERPLLAVFCSKLLQTFVLFMPTMGIKKKIKNEEDSDYEEEVYIK